MSFCLRGTLSLEISPILFQNPASVSGGSFSANGQGSRGRTVWREGSLDPGWGKEHDKLSRHHFCHSQVPPSYKEVTSSLYLPAGQC